MSGESDRETYTGALQNIYHTLGRIDGKLDSFDNRIRSLEEREAGRAAREELEIESFRQMKSELIQLKAAVESYSGREQIRDAFRRYWYVVVFLVVPIILNTINTIRDWSK